MQDGKKLTAPCGIDCFNCEIYRENLTDQFASSLHEKYGWPREEIACDGCRAQDGNHVHLPDGCATLDCVKNKGVNLCCDCSDFPCAHLAPVADLAAIRPHNIKLYNLCRIKKVGLDRWVQEEAGQIRRKYFTGRFKMGKGQTD